MVAKSESAVYVAGTRSVLLREIYGILLGLVSILIFLALVSAQQGTHWIGAVGDWVAQDCLYWVFGRYAAYCLPVMLAIQAYHALRGVSPEAARGNSWLRGLGGLMILIASCGVLALLASGEGAEHTQQAFAMGGLVGNMLIAPEGADLGLRMGRLGAMILLGGLTLIGLVIFTETLLRDMARILWGSTRRVITPTVYPTRTDRPAAKTPATPKPEAKPHVPWRMRLQRAAHWRLWHWAGAPLRLVYDSFAEFNPLDTAGELLSTLKPWGRHDREPAEPEIPVEIPVNRRGRHGSQSVFNQRYEVVLPPERSGQPGYDEQSAEGENPAADEQAAAAQFDQFMEESTWTESTQEPAASAPAVMAPPEPARPHPAALMDGERMSEYDSEPGEAIDDEDMRLPLRARGGRTAVGTQTTEQAWPERRTVPVEQSEIDLFPREFILPQLGLLADPPATVYQMSPEEQTILSRRIEQTLAQFKVEVEVFEVIQGPVITRFALHVAPGVRVNKILALESELAMALKAQHVRILAPIPGQSAVGIEVPNKRANPVVLRELLDTDAFRNHKSPLAFALGKNISGEAVVCDLAAMPHLLIAGSTGSGKSVCLNAIIASLLFRNKPDKVKFVMVDPKRVELSIYQAIPHLIAPVVSEPKKAAAALAWCVEQMEQRYKLLAEVQVRNLDSYNALATSKEPNKKLMGRELKFIPHIVIIIDELADLMMVAKAEVEEYIIRLAQMARAVGIHLVLATQRPSVNVITGIIKANFPSRIAFQVSSKVDSRTILDMNGAEALMGRGDMLYSPGGAKPFRIQGAFVADAEVERLADYIREQEKVRYEKEDFEVKPTPAERAKAQVGLDDEGHPVRGRRGGHGMAAHDLEDDGDEDEGSTIELPGLATAGRVNAAPLTPADMDMLSDEDLYDMALKLILESRKASVSYIQRRMKIGYARAGRIMDLMEERGIVGPYQGSKPRDLLVDPAQYLAQAGKADDE